MAENENRRKQPAGNCQFYLTRKKRFCKFAAQNSSSYCAEHSHLESSSDGRRRILCPRDSKHTCYEHELSDHLKHCNVTKRSQKLAAAEHFELDYNLPVSVSEARGVELGSDVESQRLAEDSLAEWSSLKSQRLFNFTAQEILETIKKFETIHNDSKFFKCLLRETDAHNSSNQQVFKTQPGSVSTTVEEPKSRFIKEQTQRQCIFDAINTRKVFDASSHPSVFVELGAGRGGLTEHFCKQICSERAKLSESSHPKVHFLLVERSPARNKLENKLKPQKASNRIAKAAPDSDLLTDAESRYNVAVSRVRIDIKDFKMSELSPIKDDVGCQLHLIAKHLCGSATDLVVNCVMNYIKEANKRPDSLCLALCCHHRCDYATLCRSARETWHSFGLTVRDFRIATLISAWATCGFQKPATNEEDQDEITPETNEDVEAGALQVLNLSSSEKERVGFVAKRVIDLACRILPLQSLSLGGSSHGNQPRSHTTSDTSNKADACDHVFSQVFLCSYIDRETTPENILLLATNLSQPAAS